MPLHQKNRRPRHPTELSQSLFGNGLRDPPFVEDINDRSDECGNVRIGIQTNTMRRFMLDGSVSVDTLPQRSKPWTPPNFNSPGASALILTPTVRKRLPVTIVQTCGNWKTGTSPSSVFGSQTPRWLSCQRPPDAALTRKSSSCRADCCSPRSEISQS